MEYLTVEEVARLLSLKPRTIRRWVTCHKIPARKVCNAVRFRRDELELWLEHQRLPYADRLGRSLDDLREDAPKQSEQELPA